MFNLKMHKNETFLASQKSLIFRKSQTATEYLVILAVVIVIALVVVGVMGGIPSLGGGVSASAAKAALASQKIAITNFAVSDYNTDLLFQNNYNERIEIDTITINGEECLFFYGTKHIFRPGEKKTIVCQNVYELEQDKVNWLIEINWTDLNTGARYTQSGNDLALVGAVSSEYISTVTANSYWNGVNGCYDNSTSNNPICTCIDLNKTRLNLAKNHTLQNSIDFNRCKEEFGVDFTESNGNGGWEPIGSSHSDSFRGTFDGGLNIVKNLYINMPGTQNLGLFGYTWLSTVKDIGVVNNQIIGDSSNVGGLVGTSGGDVDNTFATGSIIGGGSYTGGLMGYGIAGSISNSYSISSVSGSNYVGGLVGDVSGISNSYSIGSVSGSNSGGLVGFNSAGCSGVLYWVNTSQNPDTCESGLGAPCTGCIAVSSIYDIPIR